MAYIFNDNDYTPEYRIKLKSYLIDEEAVNKRADSVIKQSAENAGLSAGEVGSSFVSTVGLPTAIGCTSGGLLGSAVPVIGTLIGLGVGCSVGALVGLGKWVFDWVTDDEVEEKMHNARESQIKHIKSQAKSLGLVRDIKMSEFSDIRGDIRSQAKTDKKLIGNKFDQLKFRMDRDLDRAKFTYQKNLTALNVREAQAGTQLENAIKKTERVTHNYKLSRVALAERFSIEKRALDSEANVITNKYYMADLSKDLLAVNIARQKQQQVLQDLRSDTESMNATDKANQSVTKSIKEVSDSISKSNAIEQMEIQAIMSLRDIYSQLKAGSEDLSNKRFKVGKNYELNFAQLNAKTADILGDLEARRTVLDVELQGLSQQREALNREFNNLNSYSNYGYRLLEEQERLLLGQVDQASSRRLREVNVKSLLFQNSMSNTFANIHQKIDQMGLADDLQQLLNLQKSVEEAYNAMIEMGKLAGSSKVSKLLGGEQIGIPDELFEGLYSTPKPYILPPKNNIPTFTDSYDFDPFANSSPYVV